MKYSQILTKVRSTERGLVGTLKDGEEIPLSIPDPGIIRLENCGPKAEDFKNKESVEAYDRCLDSAALSHATHILHNLGFYHNPHNPIQYYIQMGKIPRPRNIKETTIFVPYNLYTERNENPPNFQPT